jgi:predicted RNA-binding protein YlqC (UPF0109 family)
MTPETKQLSEVLRALVTTFIDHPACLEINAEEFTGAVYWSLRGNADDHGKLVGKGGSHVKAMTFLVAQFGVARGEIHAFKLLEPTVGVRRPATPPKTAQSFDEEPARKILERVIGALAVGEYVVSTSYESGKYVSQANRSGSNEAMPLSYVFQIAVRDDTDYRSLTVPPDVVDGATVVGALGTLYRASANKEGVKFQLEVIRP